MPTELERLQQALAGRYRIERELGRGGMAVVYLAADLKHSRPVAIKVMLPEAAKTIGPQRFKREIEIAAQLTHPHILPLHDSGEAAGELFYVMPFIDGGSLRARLEREPRLPLETALGVVRDIASALGHAHHQGLVHRDIKPENVLLSDGIGLVADFGIARVLTSADTTALTTSGVIVGTPRYMAPEQIIGGNVDERADLYSLGVVLFEMLAGEPPFKDSGRGLAYQHVSVQPPPLANFRPVPAGVAAAVMRALAKSPADRFRSAAEFAEALTLDAAPIVTESAKPADRPGNLPRGRTRFIGRERELTEGARLLDHTRLLTLTGPPGCGKTRLAIELAERAHTRYPDGTWFVDFAPLIQSERVILATAGVFGVLEDLQRPLVDRVTAHVGSSRMLLILDNCEHVLDAASGLTEQLLAACPRLQIIVTSREGLGIVGEQALALGSLRLPASGSGNPDPILASEAVEFFVDRARLADSAFRVDARNASVVVEICRRLDGIPLALELAAVRVKLLSVEEIRDRLGDRFRLLTGGSRTALPRYQTLRAAIDWSYQQLRPEDRRLFCGLGVFAGGWTLVGALRVVDPQANEFAILDALTRLVDKSLVVPTRGTASTRYSMLESVRQYAGEQLEQSGEGDSVRSRHLEYFVMLAEEARPHLQGAQQAQWLARLDAERENLLAAHEWCARAMDGSRADLRIAYATLLYWVTRGLLQLGDRVTAEALSRPGAANFPAERMQALFAGGQLIYLMGRYPEATLRLEEGLALARSLGDNLRVASLLRAIGIVAQAEGDAAKARRYMQESLELSRTIGDKRQLAIIINGLAELERAENNLAVAERLCSEFIALERDLGNRGNMASGLLNLAMVTIGLRSLERTRELLREALSIADELGSRRVGQGVLEGSAGLAAAQREWGRAARVYGAAEAQRLRMGLQRDPADEAFLSPMLATAHKALGDTAYAAAEVAGRALTYEDAVAEIAGWLAG
jgi:non-specific serine/threonine protein kinase